MKTRHEWSGDGGSSDGGKTCYKPRAFIPKRPTNFQQHQKRIEKLLSEGMHDGTAWKAEAFARYNELEDQEVNVAQKCMEDGPC